MRKQKTWLDEEVEFLKNLHETIEYKPAKHTGKGKLDILVEEMKKEGWIRTKSSIARKLYRLGLTNYSVNNEEMINKKCADCNKKIVVRKRYTKMYSDKNLRCTKCKELKRREWSQSEEGRKYQEKYRKKKKVQSIRGLLDEVYKEFDEESKQEMEKNDEWTK